MQEVTQKQIKLRADNEMLWNRAGEFSLL